MLVVFLDDWLNCCIPVRLWLLAHGLFDFLRTTAAGGADGVFVGWCHAASRLAINLAPKFISASRSTVVNRQ